MKTLIFCGMLFLSHALQAQASHTYWVVETNPIIQSSIVRFYNQDDVLLDELTVKGKLLSITRQSHKRYLNRKLKEVERKYVTATAKR